MEHNKIFVGSLSTETTLATLQETFSTFGSIEEVNLIKDRYTGESKGFAFIKFTSNSSASKALELNGSKIDGWLIRVTKAQKKKGSGGGYKPW